MLRDLLPSDTGDSAQTIALDPEVIDAFIAAEDRPGTTKRPWVMVNMVASADGAIDVGGVSGDLGGAGDTAVFMALRASADVILAGSRTVTAERYRPPMGTNARRQARMRRGQAPLPRLAVVSNQGSIDLSLPLFADAEPERKPYVLTTEQVPPDRLAELQKVAEVLIAGEDLVDMGRAIAMLGEVAEARTILVEGGAILNGLLIDADLIDEWCITIAPLLVAGEANRAAISPTPPTPRAMTLDRALESDGELILRYLRRRGGNG